MEPRIPLVTVALRAHNDRSVIDRTVAALRQQDYPTFEIICLDDHSSDGTAEFLHTCRDIRLIAPPAVYRPGVNLNILVREARGDIIIFNNSDAIPQSSTYISDMVQAVSAADVGAAYARQICRKEAWAPIRLDYLRIFQEEPPPVSWGHLFSMVGSAARREILLEYPFREDLTYSEDVEWSYRLVKRGYRIAYQGRSSVEHSHNYTCKEAKKRFFHEGAADCAIFSHPMKFSIFAKRLVADFARDFRFVWRSAHKLPRPYDLLWRFVQRFSFYRGSHHPEQVIVKQEMEQ